MGGPAPRDARVRMIESDEDTLLYASGRVPGAVKMDWTTDLKTDPCETTSGAEVREAVSRNGHRGYDRRVLRGQEQLVVLLRVLGLPAVRSHNVRMMDGGRGKWEKENRPLITRDADVRRARSTRPGAADPAIARSATRC